MSMKNFFAGCDVGSTTGKAIILDETGNIVASAIVESQIAPELTARNALGEAIAQVEGLNAIEECAGLVGTGYGRNEVPFADDNVSEISCHAKGAHYVDPSIRTIIDIGGQDIKTIAIDDQGGVLEFSMNDKCAAGTGSFFQVMSRVFKMNLDEFSLLSLTAKKSISVSAQCSVFAETEVISLLAKKYSPADIAAGIQASVAKRCFSMLKRVGTRDRIVVSGGCAKNKGLIKALEKLLRVEVLPLKTDPQLMGALGAAVFAYQNVRAEAKVA